MEITQKNFPTPCYVIDEILLRRNLELLDGIQKRAGCKILLALKAFSMFGVFPLIRKYLYGISASSLNEARLGAEEFKGEVHVCAPAYKDDDFKEILKYASHIVFNSFSQWKRFRNLTSSCTRPVECGLRINPGYSDVKVNLYNPCAPRSRLGIKAEHFKGEDLEGITGLHFHALCELDSDSLERTLFSAESKFGIFFKRMKWVNFGGGHHITRTGYDVERLCRLITGFKKKYNTEVYLEPGEAVVLNAGVLVSSILDIVKNGMKIAVLDTSAAAHMPDVIEMPYRPVIRSAQNPGKYKYTYRLGGLTCLAGDVIGDYSFEKPLAVGDRIVFEDMAHYTMVKNNTFNGVNLPSIALYNSETEKNNIIREFGYEDYRSRLS